MKRSCQTSRPATVFGRREVLPVRQHLGLGSAGKTQKGLERLSKPETSCFRFTVSWLHMEATWVWHPSCLATDI
eukprot:6492730-Amphidinium_carterae.1